MVKQLNSGQDSLNTGTNYWFFNPNQESNQDAHLQECQLAHYLGKICDGQSSRLSKPPQCMRSLGQAWSPQSNLVGPTNSHQEAATSQVTRPPGGQDHRSLRPGKPRMLEDNKHTYQALTSRMISIGGKSFYSTTTSVRPTTISSFTPHSGSSHQELQICSTRMKPVTSVWDSSCQGRPEPSIFQSKNASHRQSLPLYVHGG